MLIKYLNQGKLSKTDLPQAFDLLARDDAVEWLALRITEQNASLLIYQDEKYV